MERDKLHEVASKFFEDTFKIECEVLEGGYLPTKKHGKDAGWDLYATSDIKLYPGQVLKHPLNIRLKLPLNSWAEITTKSGLGAQGQLVYAGVIDELYRGVPHVVMTNVKTVEAYNKLVNVSADYTLHDYVVDVRPNTQPLIIQKGEKVAQLIMNPYNNSYFIEQVETVDTNTSRGEGGFGSTGK